MPRRFLDQNIMAKLATKLGKPINAISVMVSKKAAKLGISAEAALILLAKEHGIGTAIYQRSLDPTKQAQVRDALPTLFAPITRRAPAAVGSNARGRTRSKGKISENARLKLAIEYLIQDSDLRSRCSDILLAASKFDRPINQATQVLEDRIRKKAQPPRPMTGESLVGFSFNEDISKTVLRVESNNPDDQRGLTQILRGIVPAFRNITHHHIVDSFSRAEAMSVCGFINVLLRAVDNSVKVK